ncbi:MAG: FAD-binding protein, partial [Methylobacterium sp.]
RSGASFRVEAGAVVLATGGCAFFERILGGTGLTGDGHLFAAEAGASLSGMEFTGKYTLAPRGTSLNKGLPFRWASFYRADGTPLEGPQGEPLANGIGPAERIIARALTEGDVLARLDLADEPIRDALRRGQPNCFAPYDKMGIDPFREMFPVELKFEGTIRGTGGIRIASSECATEIPGLYVAGDAASRENVAGGFSGGGAINSSWAMASGWWAGRGAGAHARRRRGRLETAVAPLGRTGLRARGEAAPIDLDRAARIVRAEIAPLERNYHRTAATLASGREAVEAVWHDLEAHLQPTGRERLRAREVAAVTAATRWTLTAADLRTESRGVHRRSDFPGETETQRRRIAVSGLGSVQAVWDEDADALGRLEGVAS